MRENILDAPLVLDIYNTAAWNNAVGETFLLGRKINYPLVEGNPDFNSLSLYKVKDNCIIDKKTVWQPDETKSVNLEDPRAMVLPDGRLQIGFSVIKKDADGYHPYPGYVSLSSGDIEGELPSVFLAEGLPKGKNTLPISENRFMYRPDGDDNSHKFIIFEHQNDQVKKVGEVRVPVFEWNRDKSGTTFSPIWINNKEALILIHGFRIEETKQGSVYIYSIGKGKLTFWEDSYFLDLAKEPLITPRHFEKDGKDIYPQLHNDKKVVYLTGGVLKNDQVTLFVNVGDTTTVTKVYSLEELKKGLF